MCKHKQKCRFVAEFKCDSVKFVSYRWEKKLQTPRQCKSCQFGIFPLSGSFYSVVLGVDSSEAGF